MQHFEQNTQACIGMSQSHLQILLNTLLRSKDVLRRIIIMSSMEEVETEETVTCLHITLYHPCQEEKQVFRSLKFHKRERCRVDEVAKFGRDSNICHYNLMDTRVSRVQFTLQFFRQLNSSELGFEIKNMSKKTKLIVDNVELDYLNKIDLPWKCIIRFGDYQLLMQRQDGESVDYFETCFELAQASLLQERHLPSLQPIPECGISPSLVYSQGVRPVEMDENDL
ncbi:TRAF-interacting protein with FHA domain-containing protein A isoform X2 [Mauremys reevesii]|uniref:TRAF-interacting protein with FHA domain-containing protein A isoform X2 n=1 Tax=Mauremys reevesii TaxID=260615 RepID=UPI00193F7165|nr:TRAF-interacting protein with FHA domain-containing protein A isoform X2 [Mauremys reevesii]